MREDVISLGDRPLRENLRVHKRLWRGAPFDEVVQELPELAHFHALVRLVVHIDVGNRPVGSYFACVKDSLLIYAVVGQRHTFF